MGTCAVSRYKFDRSQSASWRITMQDLNCGQMSESGCIYHYKAVLRAGVKAKSVTSNLPILSVLWARPFLSVIKNRQRWLNCAGTSSISQIQLKEQKILFLQFFDLFQFLLENLTQLDFVRSRQSYVVWQQFKCFLHAHYRKIIFPSFDITI